MKNEDECCYGTGFETCSDLGCCGDAIFTDSWHCFTWNLGLFATCKACHLLRGSAERRNKGNRIWNERMGGKLGIFEGFL